MKYLLPTELRELGVLIELNRQLLHPRGLAAELQIRLEEEDGGPTYTLDLDRQDITTLQQMSAWMRELVPDHYGEEARPNWLDFLDRLDAGIEEALSGEPKAILRVRDERDDPEGVYFADLDADDRARAARFEALVKSDREKLLGYVVQPLELT